MHHISRRRFVALTATGLAASSFKRMTAQAGGSLTAQDVIDRIQKNIGSEWKPGTVDTFKIGDPSTAVTGIVTTALASLDVLSRAVKAGANLIITSEPTFYSKADSPTPAVRRGFGGARPGVAGAAPAAPPAPPPPDPVFTAKNDFLKKNNLVVWRFSEHWAMRTPNPYVQGMVDTLGWTKYTAPGDPRHVSIPQTSLDALVSHVKQSLNSRGGMRIVGDPRMPVRSVALLPGTSPIQDAIKTLPGVDVILAGEVREWETPEYVRDTVALGGKKALVLVGRYVSEEPGMQLCAQWLKTIVPEVKSTWISAGDPYWRPTL